MNLIRSLGRGLKVLAALNADGDHTVASLARKVCLPRTTTFRLLCTLIDEGYVWRDVVSDTYHPSAMVLALSDGFDETARLLQIANPLVTELGRQLVWPVTIATRSGTSVLLRQTTDASSPLAVVRYAPGYRAPIADRAAGLVLLAYASHQQQQMLLDALNPKDASSDMSRLQLERRVKEVRSLGYAYMHRPGRLTDHSSIAVPVQVSDDALAALAVRFARSAVSHQVVMEKFLPALRQTASDIVAAFHNVSIDGSSSQRATAERYSALSR